jgi:glycosyltransferase involved in cell wall biosynthesis
MANKKNPEVSIAIPIYNEEAGIEETVTNLVKVFENNKVVYELVLVNHGSTDNTRNILDKMAKKNKRLNHIYLEKNRGYGGGIMYGFEHSNGEYIGFTCADEEVSAEDVYRVYDALRKSDYDVSKSRRMERKDGLFRKFTSFIFNSLISIRFNLGIKDINGYPIFMKKELFPHVKTKEIAYLFNLDFLYNMKKKNYKIIEVPIIHHERKKGKSFMKLSRIFKMAFGFFKYAIGIRDKKEEFKF